LKTLALIALLAAAPSPSPPGAPSPAAPDSLEEIERQLASASAPPALPARTSPAAPRPTPLAAPAVLHDFPNPHEHFEPHRHEPHHWYAAFEQDFMQRAVVVGLLAGTLCTWLGVFVVLRRMVFVGIALAQIASAGVALAVFMSWEPVVVATLLTVSFSVFSGLTRLRGTLSPETRVGLAHALGGALAVLLLSKSGTGEAEQLEMLQGSLLTVPFRRMWELAFLLAVAAGVHVVGFRKLVAVAFDPLSAQVGGINVARWNLIFFLLLGAGVSSSIQSCGLLLVFGYLLIPAAVGLIAGFRLNVMMGIAVVSSALATVAGLGIAYEADLPPGPAVVVALLVLFVFAGTVRFFREGRLG
jgi:ABC-type Mn2+/Zn2+ transport system permease subunit